MSPLMASSKPSFSHYKHISCRHHKHPLIRSQAYQDEGKSAHIVDSNLNVLKKRIEELRNKERLNSSPSSISSSCKTEHCYGWTYQSTYVPKHKRQAMFLVETIGCVVGSASGALGFAFLSGSLCIFLVSFLVHFTSS